MTSDKLVYQDYVPLYVNGQRDKARRYVNKAGHTISVRQFQKNAHVEAGTVKQPARTEQETMKKFYGVVKRLGKGETLEHAAKAEGISPSTIRKLNEQRTPDRMYKGKLIPGAARRAYSPAYNKVNKAGKAVRTGFQLNNTYHPPVLIINPDGSSSIKHIECDRINANILGSYWNNAKYALNEGEYDLLKRFEGKYVYDIHGNAYTLITDPNELESAYIGLPENQKKDMWSRVYSSQKAA